MKISLCDIAPLCEKKSLAKPWSRKDLKENRSYLFATLRLCVSIISLKVSKNTKKYKPNLKAFARKQFLIIQHFLNL
jgi:hypothetical protein